MNFLNRPFIYLYSFLFGLRYLPISVAIHVPIIVWPFAVRVRGLKRGQIKFSAPLRHAMVVMGFMGTEGRSTRKSLISVRDGGELVFGNNVTLAKGTQMIVNKGQFHIGNNFFCNGDCFFTCDGNITIGDDCLFGWDIDLNTTDGHSIMIDDKWKKTDGPINLGNHIWVCSGSHISKNVTIADDCVVAQRSLVNKSCTTTATLLGGMPARDIRHDIQWAK